MTGRESSAGSSAGETRTRGRPRRAETDRLIRDAALGLLRGQGPSAVTIEGVAAQSGVARTTVYRRFPDRAALLAAVLDELVEAGLPAPELPVADKLRWELESALQVLDQGIGRGGTAAVLTGADPVFTAVLRERLADRLGELEAEIAADVEAGLLRPSVDPDVLVGLFLGAYLGEVLRYGEPRPGWADRTAALLLPAVVPPD